VDTPIRIGMDTAKSVFQLHGVDENETVVLCAAMAIAGHGKRVGWGILSAFAANFRKSLTSRLPEADDRAQKVAC
jgi:hypothetical protein